MSCCVIVVVLLKWLPQWPKLLCSFRTKPVGGNAGHRPGRCGGLSPASRLPAAQRPALSHLLLRGHAQWEPAQPLLPRGGRHRLHGPWRPQDDAELLVQAAGGGGDPAAGHAPRRPRHPAAGLPLCLHPGYFFFWRFSMESEFASTLVRFFIYNLYFCYLREEKANLSIWRKCSIAQTNSEDFPGSTTSQLLVYKTCVSFLLYRFGHLSSTLKMMSLINV